MNAPYTVEQRDASRKVDAYKDKIREAKRRWPDWEWEDLFEYDAKGVPTARLIYGRWSIAAREHGLKLPVPLTATKDDIKDAKDIIAHAALFNDEMRKAAL